MYKYKNILLTNIGRNKMAGNWDFIDIEMKCPHCDITVEVAVHRDEERGVVTYGLCGGSAICPECQEVIDEEDFQRHQSLACFDD